VANTVQARKRVRQAEKSRKANASMRSMFRTYIKKVLAEVEAGNQDGAKSALERAIPVIDKMASKGVIHKNKAARQKSRLNAKVKAIAA